jgi:hypothetical protein
VKDPSADVQYRFLITIAKFTQEQHLRVFPKAGPNSSEWMNSQHLQTSFMTNAVWIYARRDVFASNGFAYKCSGRIKRISSSETNAIQQFGGEDGELVADLQRILDSIE